MRVQEFWDKVHGDDVLEWVGCDRNANEVLVRDRVRHQVMAMAPSAILDNDWEFLRSVLVGDRNPQVIKHLSRIVGYFSWTRNWNRSKLAELADRRRGDYRVGIAT
ncbi:MAG: hypothetical protein GF400_09675 [Candidatus Eisenbacteria bacterium]|nr:hypothetical protein [Candidatus Eisenbacteria bacterium]